MKGQAPGSPADGGIAGPFHVKHGQESRELRAISQKVDTRKPRLRPSPCMRIRVKPMTVDPSLWRGLPTRIRDECFTWNVNMRSEPRFEHDPAEGVVGRPRIFRFRFRD